MFFLFPISLCNFFDQLLFFFRLPYHSFLSFTLLFPFFERTYHSYTVSTQSFTTLFEQIPSLFNPFIIGSRPVHEPKTARVSGGSLLSGDDIEIDQSKDRLNSNTFWKVFKESLLNDKYIYNNCSRFSIANKRQNNHKKQLGSTVIRECWKVFGPIKRLKQKFWCLVKPRTFQRTAHIYLIR